MEVSSATSEGIDRVIQSKRTPPHMTRRVKKVVFRAWINMFFSWCWRLCMFHYSLHYASDHFEKTFSFELWVYYTSFSGIFWAIKRRKLELPQINRKFNFNQFSALNFQNQTNGLKFMVILPLLVGFELSYATLGLKLDKELYYIISY